MSKCPRRAYLVLKPYPNLILWNATSAVLFLQQRYLSFHSGFGSRFVNGEASLEECEEQSRKQNGEFSPISGRSEQWEATFQRYIDSKTNWSKENVIEEIDSFTDLCLELMHS